MHRRAVLEHRMFRDDAGRSTGAPRRSGGCPTPACGSALITHRLYANWGHAVAVGDTVAWLDDRRHPLPRPLLPRPEARGRGRRLRRRRAAQHRGAAGAPATTSSSSTSPTTAAVAGPRARAGTRSSASSLDLVSRSGRPVQGQLTRRRAAHRAGCRAACRRSHGRGGSCRRAPEPAPPTVKSGRTLRPMETDDRDGLPADADVGVTAMVDREQEQATAAGRATWARRPRRARPRRGSCVAVRASLVGVAVADRRGSTRIARLGRRLVRTQPQRPARHPGHRRRSGATVFAVRRYRDAVEAHAVLERLATTTASPGSPTAGSSASGFDEMLERARRTNGRIAVLFVDLDRLQEDQRHLRPRGRRPAHDRRGRAHARGRRARRRGRALRRRRVRRASAPTSPTPCRPSGSPSGCCRRSRRRSRWATRPLRDLGVHRHRHHRGALHPARRGAARRRRRHVPGQGRRARAATPLFDRSMRDQITPSTAERRLREALENGEFRLYYQPIVSLWTKRLVGVEALLRWNDPNRGVVGPDEFIGALEETGLIVPVGNWIIEEVCRQSPLWQDGLPGPPAAQHQGQRLGPPARPGELRRPTCASAWRPRGADPDHICLEITESGLLDDVDAAWSHAARGQGARRQPGPRRLRHRLLVAHLPAPRSASTCSSIDKSFIDGLGASREDTTIVEHVIGMAKALGIVTVAEGVETEEQVEHLRSHQLRPRPGLLLQPPQPPDVITQLLDAGGWRRRMASADPDGRSRRRSGGSSRSIPDGGPHRLSPLRTRATPSGRDA